MAVFDLLADSQADTGLGLSDNISRGSREDDGRVRAYVRTIQRPAIRAGRSACGAVRGGRGALGTVRVLGGRGWCARERGGWGRTAQGQDERTGDQGLRRARPGRAKPA
jgi:hypothetical protein